jgi:GNAT superfamily N-acetyltransferase
VHSISSTAQIRDARDDDREAIKEVTVSAFEQYADPMSPEGWDRYRDNILSIVDEGGPGEWLVAEMNGEIVGNILLYPAGTNTRTLLDGSVVTNEIPEARLLGVAPAARGQGIGKALMLECVRRAAEWGAPALSLHTADIMQVAMGMYERMGFERAPDLDFHPAPDVTIKGFVLKLGEVPR